MDVLEGLLSEVEFRLFNAGDYLALRDVLDGNIAEQLQRYLDKEGQDPLVVDSIKSFLGPDIEAMTLPKKLRDEGYVELISRMSPQVLIQAYQDPEYIKDVHRKLRFLEANYNRVASTYPERTMEKYQAFLNHMSIMLCRATEPLTYPDLIARIENNRYMFYAPRGAVQSTYLAPIMKRRRIWLQCLRGLDYKEYCDSRGISFEQRRLF